jgi:hypothetical protein
VLRDDADGAVAVGHEGAVRARIRVIGVDIRRRGLVQGGRRGKSNRLNLTFQPMNISIRYISLIEVICYADVNYIINIGSAQA